MEEEQEAQNEISYQDYYPYDAPGVQEETSEEFTYSPAPSRSSPLDFHQQQQRTSSSYLSEERMSPPVVSQRKRGRPSNQAAPSKKLKKQWTGVHPPGQLFFVTLKILMVWE